jgi:hypothetical protein
MVYYEVIEDLGDGSCATFRFRNKENADAFVEANEEWCGDGVTKVDTESPFFFKD